MDILALIFGNTYYYARVILPVNEVGQYVAA